MNGFEIIVAPIYKKWAFVVRGPFHIAIHVWGLGVNFWEDGRGYPPRIAILYGTRDGPIHIKCHAHSEEGTLVLR
jgi:hypothetical protein